MIETCKPQRPSASAFRCLCSAALTRWIEWNSIDSDGALRTSINSDDAFSSP